MTPQNVTAIDGLKVFALIFLCLHHIAYGFLMINHHSGVFEVGGFDFYPLFVNGWVSFEFFYGICGFYAAHYFLTNPSASYRQYALKICVLILPVYYLVFVFSVMEWFPHFKVPFENDGFSHLYHVLMLSDVFLPSNNVMLGTMAVEFKFLLLAPLIVFYVRRFKNPKQALFLLTAVIFILGVLARGWSFSKLQLAHDHYHMDYFMFFMYCRMAFIYVMEPMLVGILCAFLYQAVQEKTYPKPSLRQAQWLFYIGLVALIIWSASVDHYDLHTFYDALFQPWVTAVIFAMILWGCVFDGAPKCFSGRFSSYFSKRVLGIYIIHIPLIQFSYNMAIQSALALKLPLTEVNIVLLFFILNIAISWIITEILYQILEKPCQDFLLRKKKPD